MKITYREIKVTRRVEVELYSNYFRDLEHAERYVKMPAEVDGKLRE
ncbi:MAG: hypothetical protein RMH84_02005 [Sulfolobales archaeon]|nr:hypothetical protein [Sulfolobales archaeon]MDW8010351.1 hypothetical protein [Sulfolobales archaeon]